MAIIIIFKLINFLKSATIFDCNKIVPTLIFVKKIDYCKIYSIITIKKNKSLNNNDIKHLQKLCLQKQITEFN